MDLHLDNLTKRFGERLAVEIPALTIPHGEFFTFVGPSGCGKSSTLNLIAGLEAITTGTIRLGDRLLNDLPPHRRDVAFVFQSYALYPHRTVARNLAFPLEMAGCPRKDISRRVQEAAALLGLAPLLEKYPRQLSGGERQRVALGRALVRQPKLFLFDEPLSNLDAPLRAQMRKELKRLHAELGSTFIYVTHDQDEALSLSDRVAVMQAGRIQQCGPPSELYDVPANRFVASFFGSPPMNFVDAKLTAADGAFWVELEGRRVRLNQAFSLREPLPPVTLGVRPEHIRVSREPQPEGWPARVLLVEAHGSQNFFELQIGGLRFSAVEDSRAGFRPGDIVWAGFAPDRVHVFEAETGARVALPPPAPGRR